MYKSILILVALNSLFGSINAGEFYTSEYGNSFYVEKESQFTWYDAIHVCTSKNMRLIALDTEKKHLEIAKLLSSLNFVGMGAWTSGHETDSSRFVWTSTGNNVTSTKWITEPSGTSSSARCIAIYDDRLTTSRCASKWRFICEENPIVKESMRDLEAQQTAELNKMKSYYENETNTKLEQLKQSCRNETEELTRVNLEELHALKSDLKTSYENETNRKLEDLKKSNENDKNHLLDEKQREISVLKLDCEKQLNELTLVNKIQENNILKTFHAKELHLQEEKHNYCENETNKKLEVLKKLHEKDRNHLLDEKQLEISVLKTDFEKQINQLTLANKIQEIELLKTFHTKELRLQEEKQNYALTSLKSFYDISNNRTGSNKSYNFLFNVHGNRN